MKGKAVRFLIVYAIFSIQYSDSIYAYLIKGTPMEKNHFDGSRFSNLDNFPNRSWWDALKWLWTRSLGTWPSYSEQNALYDKPPTSVKNDDLRVSFIGHATVLMQMKGLNILTDPHWSKRAGPFSLFGHARVHPAGVKFEDLPKIDVVVISHNHYDHMDMATLKKLEHAHKPLFIVPRSNDHYLKSLNAGKRVIALDWWDSYVFNEYRITCVPVHHWSARTGFDKNKALWGGYVIKTKQGPVFFAGDTGFADGKPFERIYKKFGPLRLALLPIGAYEPRDFMQPAHMNPEEAVKAHILLHADYSLAIHFELFAHLTDESYDQPRKDLAIALRQHQVLTDSFRALHVGEHWLIKKV